jgi:hypothetical protein
MTPYGVVFKSNTTLYRWEEALLSFPQGVQMYVGLCSSPCGVVFKSCGVVFKSCGVVFKRRG